MADTSVKARIADGYALVGRSRVPANSVLRPGALCVEMCQVSPVSWLSSGQG
jgi:hypothetical protein